MGTLLLASQEGSRYTKIMGTLLLASQEGSSISSGDGPITHKELFEI
jgi:hypothetical protein